MKTINNTRRINSKQIINHILFENNHASQNDLLNSLHLDNSTIKRICDTLISEDILVEETLAIKGKGRPPKAYSINGSYKTITVLLLGTEKTQIFNYKINLELISHSVIDYSPKLQFEEKLDLVISKIEKQETDICFIVTSGSIDNTNRKLLRHYRFNIHNFDISNYFESRLNIPTFAENNMNAFAINYLYTKVPDELKNFAVLSAEQGLGAGFILDGTLYRGYEGNAGEVGHSYYKDSPTDCYCNRNGCVELFMSTKYFAKNKIELSSIDDWRSIKESNPMLAASIIDDFSSYASHLLRNIDMSLNIHTFFVSGLIFQILMDNDYIDSLNEKLEKNQVNAQLILVDNDEQNFHLGGAILAAIKLLKL